MSAGIPPFSFVRRARRRGQVPRGLRYNRWMEFDPGCRRCPRLRHHLTRLRAQYPDYHNGPVPSFGDADAPLLIVGLAPGLHGANASGRVFTGDRSGDLLFATLYRFGFCDRPESRAIDDGMRLSRCRITNAVRCVPPGNRPNATELRRCGEYLRTELVTGMPRVIVALGRVAHDSVLRALRLPLAAHRFAHLAEHRLEHGGILLDSYHCSRYNVQTGRLTPAMFEQVFHRARALL